MYFKFSIWFLLFITITGSSLSEWQKFKHDYNKQYKTDAEEAHRKEIFLENVHRMQQHQQMYPNATFTMKINHLADRRIEELVSGTKSFSHIRSNTIEEPIQPKQHLPIYLDWREKGVIAPIYNQGQTARDATFVAVEMIESFQAIQTNKFEKGSLAQVSACCENTLDILDCVLNKMDGSLCRQADYNPTTATCGPQGCQPFAVFNKVKKLEGVNEFTMLQWIQDSPLYVGMDVREIGFLMYTGGVYSDKECSKTELDHVLQLIGYGIYSGTPYWLLKNTWGETWGDKGYIRVERGTNTCGIATYVAQIEYKTRNTGTLPNYNGVYLICCSLLVYFFRNLK